MTKDLKIDIFIYVALFCTCVFILLESTLAPFAVGDVGVDSGVFIYSAKSILKGNIMYKDIVDHKGPFLYVINILGLLISNGKIWGLWIVEVLSLYATSILLYKIARFFYDKYVSFAAVFTSLIFIITIFKRGNTTEEWALPYISAALYIFTDYLVNGKKLSQLRLFVLSLTFVLAFLLRANLVGVWVGFGAVIIFKLLREKKYKEFFTYAASVIIYVIISLAPFVLYLYFNNALFDAYYWSIKFNTTEYTLFSGRLTLLTSFITTIFEYRLFSILIPVAFVCLFFVMKNNRYFFWGLVFAFLMYSLTTGMGIAAYYYATMAIPLLVIPFGFVYNFLCRIFIEKKYIRNEIVVLLLFGCIFCTKVVILHANNTYYNFFLPNKEKRAHTVTHNELCAIAKFIDEHTLPNDNVLVAGNQCSVYLYSNRMTTGRFPYFLEYSSFVRKNYIPEIKRTMPKLIVKGKQVNNVNRVDISEVLDYMYEPLYTDIPDVEFYILKDNYPTKN